MLTDSSPPMIMGKQGTENHENVVFVMEMPYKKSVVGWWSITLKK